MSLQVEASFKEVAKLWRSVEPLAFHVVFTSVSRRNRRGIILLQALTMVKFATVGFLVHGTASIVCQGRSTIRPTGWIAERVHSLGGCSEMVCTEYVMIPD